MEKNINFNKEQFLELYNQGKTDTEIGEIMGFNRRYICGYRNKLNLKNKKIERLSLEVKEKIVSLVNEGKTDKEIAKILNIKEFQEFLKTKFNLSTTIHSQNVLYIKACSKDLFTKLIKPYIIPCMQYKLHN